MRKEARSVMMHIPDRHGVVAKVAGKHYLALTAQEKSCVTLLDVVCNIGWSFGRDGEPKTKAGYEFHSAIRRHSLPVWHRSGHDTRHRM